MARVAEFPSLAAHGDSQDAALRSLQQVVKAVLKDMAASKEPVPQPLGKRSFSGRLNVRMPSYLHRYLAIEAAQQSVLLNQLILTGFFLANSGACVHFFSLRFRLVC